MELRLPARRLTEYVQHPPFGNGVAGHFTIYHAGWGTLLGVGVGFVFVHRHRILAWLAGLTAVAVTYFEHMSTNFVVERPLETPPLVGDLFQAGDHD